MLVEKFVIFKFDNVFYTKEELEALGFKYMIDKNDYVALNSEKKQNYEIKEQNRICESIHLLDDYLNYDNKLIEGKFLYDFGNSGLILDVEKYYGLRYKNKGTNKGKLIQLFKYESDCDRAYEKIKKGIYDYFEEFSKSEPSMYVEDSKELIRQEEEKETRQYILSLLNKENK